MATTHYGPYSTHSLGGTPFYYAAIFHAKDHTLAYRNYAYTFEPRPPFRILSVARRPLRLRGERVRFVSGLARLAHFDEGDPLLGLSYGVDDRTRQEAPHASCLMPHASCPMPHASHSAHPSSDSAAHPSTDLRL